MNRYKIDTPRTIFGIAAVAMAVLTLGFAVILPATIGHGDAGTEAAAQVVAPPTEVAINPSRIDVVGVREQSVASASISAHIDTVGVRPRELAAAGASRVASE
jgi:hypothetical protein